MNRDLSKNDLYESVKTLVENSENKTIHLNQHKLYSLFSIAFQYILYKSTKDPGAYIIRIENSMLLDKLARKSKDSSTRRFIQSLTLPRKLKYGKSTFFLDFFNFGTWNLTSEIPPNKLKGTVIVKRGFKNQLEELNKTEEEQEENLNPFPEDYYLTSLCEVSPLNIFISHEDLLEGFKEIRFPFIKEEKERAVSGVKINEDINWDDSE